MQLLDPNLVGTISMERAQKPNLLCEMVGRCDRITTSTRKA